jgi:hypothetical protein
MAGTEWNAAARLVLEPTGAFSCDGFEPPLDEQ